MLNKKQATLSSFISSSSGKEKEEKNNKEENDSAKSQPRLKRNYNDFASKLIEETKAKISPKFSRMPL